VVTFQKVKRYQWSPKIKNFNVIPNLIVWLAFKKKKKNTNVARDATLVTVKKNIYIYIH
jgi:hypothetical protein